MSTAAIKSGTSQLPPHARDVILARDHGYLLNDIYIACGWPSERLKRRVSGGTPSTRFPSLLDAAHAIATPKHASRYRWHWVVGLSVVLWAETAAQAAIHLYEVAPMILAASPLLLQLWSVWRGAPQPVTFIKLGPGIEVGNAT